MVMRNVKVGGRIRVLYICKKTEKSIIRINKDFNSIDVDGHIG